MRIVWDETGTAEAAERIFEIWAGGGGVALIVHQAKRIPNSNFPKCPLRSSLAQANLFAISKVSTVCP